MEIAICILFSMILFGCSQEEIQGTKATSMNKKCYHAIPSDEIISFGTEWGFMGVLDLDAYDHDLKVEWTPEILLKKAIESMNDNVGFFWGTAEVSWNILINPVNRGKYASRVKERFGGYVLASKGRLCLTDCDSLGFAAQFPNEYPLPQEEDIVFEVEPGLYYIEVHQLFSYDGGDQLPEDQSNDFRREEVHYILSITKSEKPSAPQKFEAIPVQAGHYRLNGL